MDGVAGEVRDREPHPRPIHLDRLDLRGRLDDAADPRLLRGADNGVPRRAHELWQLHSLDPQEHLHFPGARQIEQVLDEVAQPLNVFAGGAEQLRKLAAGAAYSRARPGPGGSAMPSDVSGVRNSWASSRVAP